MPLHNELWFPSPIWSGKFFNVDNEDIENFSSALRQRTSGVIKSNYGGWQSDSIGRGHSVGIDTLVDNLDREIYEICKQTSLPQLEIYNIWINVNPKNCFNIQHDHIGAVFTGVYYVKAKEGNGNIRFERPDNARFFLPDLTENQKQNYFNTQMCEYKSITNAIYIFPGWLPHSVEPNLINEDRISVSFNYGVKR
tara:strand:+ start:499 stop:1083 length:585 start_codon:yes stop_codon:yes gene_type:complete